LPALRSLGRSKHGFPDGLRQGDRAKESSGVEIILAGFIDDPQQPAPLGVGVAQRDVDFSRLERRPVAVVVDADDQLPCLCLCMVRVSKQVLDLEFLAPDPNGFIPVYLSELDRAAYCAGFLRKVADYPLVRARQNQY
jgi:hypothetical protein